MLDPTATTALGTLAGRALDARGSRVLGDDAAARVVAALDPELRQVALRGLGVDPDLAISIAVRARLIDQRVQEFLTATPEAVVIHAGCGLDTRYERLAPPASVTWYEVDRAPIMELRRRVLGGPGESHREVCGSISDPATLDQIPAGRPTLFVAEGLTMYLTPELGAATLARVVDRFGRRGGAGGRIVLDVTSRLGIRLQRATAIPSRAGARLRWGIDDPAALEALGMRLIDDIQADAMLRAVSPYLGPRRVALHARAARLGPIRRMGRILSYEF